MAKETESAKGSSITLQAHGDGTYHTIAHGQHDYMAMERGKEPGRKDHASFGEALMHIAKMHGPEGDHMHVHGDESGFTSHHVIDHGRVRGPVEHTNSAAVGRHVAETMQSAEEDD